MLWYEYCGVLVFIGIGLIKRRLRSSGWWRQVWCVRPRPPCSSIRQLTGTLLFLIFLFSTGTFWICLNDQGSFQLYYTKKSFSIFWMPKKLAFVKRLPIICCKMVPPYFCKILEHILTTNHQLVASEILLSTSTQKDKFLLIHVEIAKFELQVLHSLLMIFKKNHF